MLCYQRSYKESVNIAYLITTAPNESFMKFIIRKMTTNDLCLRNAVHCTLCTNYSEITFKTVVNVVKSIPQQLGHKEQNEVVRFKLIDYSHNYQF